MTAAQLAITGLLLGGLYPMTLAAENAEAPAETEAEAGSPQLVDNLHEATQNWFQDTIGRIDRFFVSSDYATFVDNESRLRLRLNTDYVQHHGWELSPKLKLNLKLPGANERLRLVINDDYGQDADQASAAADDDNDVALRFMARQSKRIGIAADLGLRIKDAGLDPFARLNTGFQYQLPGKWVGQSSNRLYYYSKTGWRNDFRQFFNRPLNDNLLFRSRTRIEHRAENEYNPFIEQKFSLFQTLSDDTALAYEVLWRRQTAEDSPFDEDEILIPLEDRYDHVMLMMRYRRSFWRPWLFAELWPIVGWTEERDWEPVLAARLRLEVNLGWLGDSRLDE